MMDDIRLKTVDYELDGRTYRLACNMNVLADVQEAYNGNLVQALNTSGGLKGTLEFLAAMLTDAADTQGVKDADGCPLRFTAKELGRELTLRETVAAGEKIMPIIRAAVAADTEEEKQKN